MSHFFCGLVLLLAAGFSHSATLDLISNSRLGDKYIDAIMRLSKAAEIKSYMNQSVNPCDDFYQFACGNWERINRADNNHVTTGLFERLSEAFDRKVKQALNKDNKQDTSEDIQVKNFYKSCKRVEKIDTAYQQELKDLIKKFGTMPVLEGDEFQEENFDWLNTTATINLQYGIYAILGTEVTKDLANNSFNLVYIVQQDFPLESKSMYLDEQTAIYRQKYQELIAKDLQLYLGIESSLAVKTAKEIMDLEIELAKGLMDENADVDLAEITKLMTLDEMQALYAPDLDIKKLVNISIGVGIENVYDFQPEYKKNVIKVLHKTSKRTLANYIYYRLISEFTIKPGKTEEKREHNCLDATRKYFSKPLDRMIYRHYNNNETANEIELMWREIKQTFSDILQSEPLNWISAKTRKLAMEKLAAMKFQINSYANEDMSEDFKDMYLQDERYIDNLRSIYRVNAGQERDLLNQPVKPIEMSEILSFTPANILVENIIKVPVAVLQPYFLWAPSYPNAIKFGTLGALIGHELIHGFDTQGRKFDESGNLNDWWDTESTENFVTRQHCFTQQYSKYSYNGQMLPATDAQSENIADNGGVHLAYSAYFRWLNSHTNSHLTSESLPTLPYTNMQLFFISYAQIWCNDVHPRVRNLQIATDDHVPGGFRVIGPLSNFEEFSKEFQCELGTRMNPVNKCKLY